MSSILMLWQRARDANLIGFARSQSRLCERRIQERIMLIFAGATKAQSYWESFSLRLRKRSIRLADLGILGIESDHSSADAVADPGRFE